MSGFSTNLRWSVLGKKIKKVVLCSSSCAQNRQIKNAKKDGGTTGATRTSPARGDCSRSHARQPEERGADTNARERHDAGTGQCSY